MSGRQRAEWLICDLAQQYMNAGDFPKRDPLIVLLNEIEILSAQARLLELHLERAQAIAGNRMAELQEEHRQELAKLRSDFAAAQTRFLEDSATGARGEMREDLAFLNDQLLEKRAVIANQQAEIAQAREESAALRAQASRLAAVCAAAESNIGALAAQLGESRSRLHAAGLAGAEQQQRFEALLAQAESQLQGSENRLREALGGREQAQEENTRLHCRLAELEVLVQETEQRAAKEIEQMRHQFDHEVGDLRSAWAARERLLEEKQVAASESERRLRISLIDLETELGHSHKAVGLMEQQLRASHERMAELEALYHAVSERALRLEEERYRNDAELEALHHRIAMQERELTGRYEAVSAVELALHGKIQSLQQGLAETRRELADRDEALKQAESELTEARLEAEKNDSERAAAEQRLRQTNAAAAESAERISVELAERKRLEAKISDLQVQLAEKQLLAERRAAEIADLKAAACRKAQSPTAAGMISTSAAPAQGMGAAEPLARLQGDQAEPPRGYRGLESAPSQTGAELARKLLDLEDRFREADARLKTREQELAAAAVDAAMWRERIQQLEALREKERARKSEAETEQQRLKIELAAMQEELREKDWSLARQQVAAENIALTHRNQLRQVESKIDEQQRALLLKDQELAQTQDRAETLARELSALREVSREKIIERENISMKTDEENPQGTEPAANQPESRSRTKPEQALREEISRLHQEAQEKNRILEDRNDELVRVKKQLDQLQERLAQLESASGDEAGIEIDTDRMRTEFQAQLALLQAEVSQKEWTIEERQAKARALEHQLRGEIDDLKRQLSAKAKERGARELLFRTRGSNDARDEGSENDANAMATPVGLFANHRRWRLSSGRKRRWRS